MAIRNFAKELKTLGLNEQDVIVAQNFFKFENFFDAAEELLRLQIPGYIVEESRFSTDPPLTRAKALIDLIKIEE